MNRTLFLISLSVLIAGGLASALLLRLRFVKERLNNTDFVNPPFVSAVALIFGLFVALGASDVVQRSHELRLSAQKEANTARALLRLTESIGPTAEPVRQSLIEYLQAATTIELSWLASSARRADAPARVQADSLVEVATLFVTQLGGAETVKSQVMNKVDELRQARVQRIDLSQASSSISQWVGLTIIAFLTQVVIALTHSGKPNGAAAALILFSTAAMVAMAYLAWSDGLIGPSKIGFAVAPLGELLASLSRI